MFMKRIVLVLCAALLACGAVSAQKKRVAKKTKATTTAAAPAKAVNNAEEGKKWYDAERYDQARKYLKKAVTEGDMDSKVRLAAIIYNQDMDPETANAMFDECIAAGSAFALERKGFCTLQSAWDTKEDKLKSLELIQKASDMGYGDATAELFEVYLNGFRTFADQEVIVEANEEKAVEYAKKGAEQNNPECMAYVGMWTYKGVKGFEKDEEKGVQMLEAADKASRRFFATNCLEPAKLLCQHYTDNGEAAKAAPIVELLKKYHPTEY